MSKRRVEREAVAQPQDKSIRYIVLTKGQLATVDAKNYEWLNQWNWHALKRNCGNGYYAVRKSGPAKNRETVYMHRLILGLKGKLQGDHKNRNTLDNRLENLRPATASQNRCNVRKANMSGYKGVRWRAGKWVAEITVKGIYTYLGRFPEKEDAARAYNKAALRHEGEFAVLNGV